MINIAGLRFGKLIVDSVVSRGKKRIWKCLCDCGGVKYAHAWSLRGENVKSCGCFKRCMYDLTGKVFGNLTVIEHAGRNENGKRPVWLCKCICGAEIKVKSKYLHRGSRSDCGCLSRPKKLEIDQRRRKSPLERHITNIMCNYRSNSKQRGHSFNLPRTLVERYITSPCYYCGQMADKMGIDRVDNALGYEESNTVPCCKRCNYLKRDSDYQEFVDHIIRMADNLRTGNKV